MFFASSGLKRHQDKCCSITIVRCPTMIPCWR